MCIISNKFWDVGRYTFGNTVKAMQLEVRFNGMFEIIWVLALLAPQLKLNSESSLKLGWQLVDGNAVLVTVKRHKNAVVAIEHVFRFFIVFIAFIFFSSLLC